MSGYKFETNADVEFIFNSRFPYPDLGLKRLIKNFNNLSQAISTKQEVDTKDESKASEGSSKAELQTQDGNIISESNASAVDANVEPKEKKANMKLCEEYYERIKLETAQIFLTLANQQFTSINLELERQHTESCKKFIAKQEQIVDIQIEKMKLLIEEEKKEKARQQEYAQDKKRIREIDPVSKMEKEMESLERSLKRYKAERTLQGRCIAEVKRRQEQFEKELKEFTKFLASVETDTEKTASSLRDDSIKNEEQVTNEQGDTNQAQNDSGIEDGETN